MPNPLYCFAIGCVTDGAVEVWASTAPTDCPNDAGHTVNSVEPSGPQGQATSCSDEIMLNDGAGRVFKITADQNGTLSTTQVFGPAPV